MAASNYPLGMLAAARYMRVGVHLHDRGTNWLGNSATISATQLCKWFWRCFINEGLADAIAPSPYTYPDEWFRFRPGDKAMGTLLNHHESLADRSRELGYPILSSVEAQIVPVSPGDESSYKYVLDVPDEVACLLDCVIASVHAQPTNTEKVYEHVRAMRYAALQNPFVTWLSHIDRYVDFLPFPDLAFFLQAKKARKAIGLNENYFATKGPLRPGLPVRESGWGSLTDGDRPLTPEEFGAVRGTMQEEYSDYRQTHLIQLMLRAGVTMVAEFDWHLPTSPKGVDYEAPRLSPAATHRLERFGNYLELRNVPLDQVATSSLDAFREHIERSRFLD